MPASKHFSLIMNEIQPTQSDNLLAGNILRGNIRDRTFADEDLRGGNFIPYSPAYAKWKGQHNVDLYSKGTGKHMLDALTVHATENEIEIGIFGDEEMAIRAKVHNEGAVVRTRLGTGKRTAPGHSRKFGVQIFKQKKGGKPYMTIPSRSWLGARASDIDQMRQAILNAIKGRIGS